jgi:hypothetical protein
MKVNISGAYHGGEGFPAADLAGLLGGVGPWLVLWRFFETGMAMGG